MKIIHHFIIIVTLFCISCETQTKNPYPILILDDTHNQIQKNTSNVIPKNYELYSLNGFILDCTKYDFSLIESMNNNKAPDLVHIISKAGTFSIKLNINGQTVIDSTTMQSLDENKKEFSGFIKGDTAILAIGTINNNEMMAYWLGRLTIK